MKGLLYEAIGPLVFPAPECPESYYRMLEAQEECTFVTTCKDEKVPIVLLKSPDNYMDSYSNDDDNEDNDTANPDGLTIIYSHGNAEDLSLIFTFLQEMAIYTGADVISYDYVGYSFSKLEGHKPSEQGCLRSIDAVWRHATETLGIPANKIILFGRSIGSGPTVDIASRDVPFTEGVPNASKEPFKASPFDCAGIILQSPLASGTRVLLGASPVGISASVALWGLDIFRNYLKMERITSPVAIMHGINDEVVPCSNGRNLHRLSQNPFEPLWLENRGHNDMPFEDVFGYAKSFVDSIRGKSDPSSVASFLHNNDIDATTATAATDDDDDDDDNNTEEAKEEAKEEPTTTATSSSS